MPLTQQCAKIEKHPMVHITRKFWHRLHSDVKNEWICIFWVLPFWVRDKINSITCAWPNALLIGYLNGLTESCHKNTEAIVSFRENVLFVIRGSMQRYDCLCTNKYLHYIILPAIFWPLVSTSLIVEKIHSLPNIICCRS